MIRSTPVERWAASLARPAAIWRVMPICRAVRKRVLNTCTTTVGGASVTVTPGQVAVQAGDILLAGKVTVAGTLHVTGNITSGGSIMDTTGNSNHHTH